MNLRPDLLHTPAIIGLRPLGGRLRLLGLLIYSEVDPVKVLQQPHEHERGFVVRELLAEALRSPNLATTLDRAQLRQKNTHNARPRIERDKHHHVAQEALHAVIEPPVGIKDLCVVAPQVLPAVHDDGDVDEVGVGRDVDRGVGLGLGRGREDDACCACAGVDRDWGEEAEDFVEDCAHCGVLGGVEEREGRDVL